MSNVTELDKFKYAKVIGIRSTQLSNGAISTIDISKIKNNHCAIEIAKEEFRQGKIPLIIEFELPSKEKKSISLYKL